MVTIPTYTAVTAAAALVAAVADHDTDDATLILDRLDILDLRALARFLARHVHVDRPLSEWVPEHSAPDPARAIAATVRLTGVDPEDLRSDVRGRPRRHAQARAVAAVGMHMAGLSAREISTALGRRHKMDVGYYLTTVRNDLTLHRLALMVAAECTWTYHSPLPPP